MNKITIIVTSTTVKNQNEQTLAPAPKRNHEMYVRNAEKTHHPVPYLVTLDEPISKIFLDMPPPGTRIDHRRVLRRNVLCVQSRVQVSFVELRRSCNGRGGRGAGELKLVL